MSITVYQSVLHGHLGYFQFLAIINKAAMNIKIFVWIHVFISPG